MLRRLGIAATMGLALLAVACSSGDGNESSASPQQTEGQASKAGKDLTRAGEVAGVEVAATWLTESNVKKAGVDLSRYPLGEFVLVEIEFTTHSGDLNKIDMVRAALLRQGTAEVQPQTWVSVSDDSHHRAGILAFPRNLKDGPVDLAIKIGDKELALQWEAAPTT